MNVIVCVCVCVLYIHMYVSHVCTDVFVSVGSRCGSMNELFGF